MKIKQLNKLNYNQRKEVKNLVNVCLQFDGLERMPYLSNDLNYYKDLDSFYLIYSENKLVCVLTIFEILESEAEITAYTLPEERRKGYFTQLIKYAKRELLKFGIKNLLFVVEPASESGAEVVQQWTGKLQIRYDKSEYLLFLDLKNWSKYNNTNSLLRLKKLQLEDFKAVAEISAVLFDSEVEEDMAILQDSYESETMQSYVLYLENEIIGICHLNYGTESGCIFGLGIGEAYQGKGYGKILLYMIMDKIVDKKFKRVTLEVGSENEKAYKLYKNTGFQVKTQYDYYRHLS